jgi:hybrid cluster-associated redox disulfide protein
MTNLLGLMAKDAPIQASRLCAAATRRTKHRMVNLPESYRCLRSRNEGRPPKAQACNMKKIATPSSVMTVDEVMRRWPSTVRVFIDFRMNCVGCPIATFHSVDEACHEHHIDAQTFLSRLVAAAMNPQLAEAGREWPSASPNSA